MGHVSVECQWLRQMSEDETVLAELLELSRVTLRRDILEIDNQRPHAYGTHNYLLVD